MPLIATAAGPLFYLQRGAGRPVLALHGAGGTGRHWGYQMCSQAGALLDQASVIAVDLPGHGRSPGPAHSTVDDLAGAALALLDALISLMPL